MNAVMRALEAASASRLDVEFTDEVHQRVVLAEGALPMLRGSLADATSGRVRIDDQ